MNILQIKHKQTTCIATVNRPKVLNAVNFELMNTLEKLLYELENNQTRCLILTGTGKKSFISGGDLREFHTLKSAEEAMHMAKRMQKILIRIERLPCWTIAAINGSAYGGGCEIMLAFDFCISAQEATFGFTQGKFYLPPGWGGLTRLTERVGRSTALRWLAEAKNIDAEAALNRGLVDRIAPAEKLLIDALNWAESISENNRSFIKNLKHQSLQFSKARWQSMEAELTPFSEFWESNLHHQRVTKFLTEEQ